MKGSEVRPFVGVKEPALVAFYFMGVCWNLCWNPCSKAGSRHPVMPLTSIATMSAGAGYGTVGSGHGNTQYETQ